jgi:cupin superfamily acireductone dioxygenase involved in methionine salvage
MKKNIIIIISASLAVLTFGFVWYKNQSEKEETLRSEEEAKKQKELDDLNAKIKSLEIASAKEKIASSKAKLEAEKKAAESEKKAAEAEKKATEIAKIESEKNAINRSVLFKKGDSVKLLQGKSLPLIFIDKFGAIQLQKDIKGGILLRYFNSGDLIGKVSIITKKGNLIVVAKDGKLISVPSTLVTKI